MTRHVAGPREAAVAALAERWVVRVERNGVATEYVADGGNAIEAVTSLAGRLAAEPSAGVTSEAGDLAEAIGRAAGIDPAMVDVDEAARRLSRGWDERRAALADRWPGPDPMTRFEMFGAVNRDAAWGLREFAPESGVIPDDLSAAAYDRRGLLNVVASLLDRLAATPISSEAPSAGVTSEAPRLDVAALNRHTAELATLGQRLSHFATPSTSTETPTRVVGGGEREAMWRDPDPRTYTGKETLSLFADGQFDIENGKPDAGAIRALGQRITQIEIEATTPVPSVSDEGLRAALERIANWPGNLYAGDAVGMKALARRALSSEPVR